MKIAVLLCAVLMQVKAFETCPVKIFVKQKIISEDSVLYVTCSTFGRQEGTIVNVFLFRDESVISTVEQKQNQYDSEFILEAGSTRSGNYSCVCTDKTSKAETRGENVIQILVLPNFLPGVISVAGLSTVSQGDDVEFRCTLSGTLQTLGKCQLIQSYLRKNKTIIQLQVFNVTKMEATFTIEGAVMRDSGYYSCAVLPLKCITEHELTLWNGSNALLLDVKGSLFVHWGVPYGAITLIVLLCLCLCLCGIRNKQGRSRFCSSCSRSQQPSEEMLDEQQQQRREEEPDDREPLSMEEDYGFVNCQVSEWSSEDSTYNDDCGEDAAYSVVHDPPTN